MPKAAASLVLCLAVAAALADRPNQGRADADHVVVGKVRAVYASESKGYRSYVVEIAVEEVEKGAGLKKGDSYWAYCYQRKPGFGGLEFDTPGHATVPKVGQRVRAFVKK